MAISPGSQLGPYRILQALGRGGMGEVFRARHLTLQRDVAIKVLPPDVADDRTRLARFVREARTASALNHPNIVTIYDVAEDKGTTYIAMELVEGRTLRELIAEGPVPITRALHWAEQLAAGLAKAHEAGIVHRDIKPANVMVTPDGLVKILDFGLAKTLGPPRPAAGMDTTELTGTRDGVVVGTPHYMSPEQCVGDTADQRSDQFALGIVLYEMLSGQRPFDGRTPPAVIGAILSEPAIPIRKRRTDVPPDLERVIARCLSKAPEDRFPSTGDVLAALQEHSRRRARPGVRAVLQRPAVAAVLVSALVVAGAGTWFWIGGREARWARDEALAEVNALADRGEFFGAFVTGVRATRLRPDDPALQRAMERFTLAAIPVGTDPAGALVQVRRYGSADGEWETIGITPMSVRIPYALMQWRISKAGYTPFEGAPFGGGSLRTLGELRLEPEGSAPPGMVHVPSGRVRPPIGVRLGREANPIRVDAFYLDRYEVTNREYKAFVAAGGYRTDSLWTDPVEDAGQRLSREEARRRFVDATGQPGPATWEAGSYAAGDDSLPVTGISWFEAAAYCRWAGKDLPTVLHWHAAIGQDQMSDILRFSNFAGSGKAPIGRFTGLGGYGTYDMAGNVREWTSSAAGLARLVVGGGWSDPGYMFRRVVLQDPMQRLPTDGVRCAKYPARPDASLLAPIEFGASFPQQARVSDAEFALIRRQYAYDASPLEAREERTDDAPPQYRREVVSIRTAYGDERMEINLLIPRDAAPPYQSVIWFPGDDVFGWRSSEDLATAFLWDFIPVAGRVLVYPIYMGMYERSEPQRPGLATAGGREWIRRWSQDLSRTIDYLETRADFDSEKIAYYGLSSGAGLGPVFMTIESRFRAGILLGGGLFPLRLEPEVDPWVFAPRSLVPTLMLNGEEDFLFPYEDSEKPLFDALGVPADQKRLARLEGVGGHIPAGRLEIIMESLGWLDRWLGPVARTGPDSASTGRR